MGPRAILELEREMKVPKSRIAREILADPESAQKLLKAIRKNTASIEFKGRTIRIRKQNESITQTLSSNTNNSQ